MPDSAIFLAICAAVIPLALLGAYFHARCLGWEPESVPGPNSTKGNH